MRLSLTDHKGCLGHLLLHERQLSSAMIEG
jgi:hypothetical protein